MLNQIRLFISAHSPDWLNVEVNKDFFTNFSAALTSDHESEELETNSVGSAYSYGVLPLPTSSAPEASSASSASQGDRYSNCIRYSTCVRNLFASSYQNISDLAVQSLTQPIQSS